MKISIVTGPWLPVPAVQGGSVPRLWQGLAERFAAAGHEVTVLCRSFPGQPEREVINGVSFIRHGGFSQSRSIGFDLIKDLAYALRTVTRLPVADILIVNDFWLPVFASRRPSAGKVVVNANRYPKRQYYLYKGAARFAAASQAIGEAIGSQYAAAASRIKIFPNPIDTNAFKPSDTYHSQKQNERTILYVGRIHQEKGVHLLIDAFSKLSRSLTNLKLRIVGPVKENQGGGGKSYVASLQAKAQNLNVEFSDPVFDVSELVKIYQSADLFCYPSLAEKGESFGVAPLEAMATGLVPVVSDLACFRDFIDEDKSGLFFNHRHADAAAELSKVLHSALSDTDRLSQMSVRAARRAADYSFQNIAALYLQDFYDLLKV